MNKYSVVVTTNSGQVHYSAISRTTVEVIVDAISIFGVCGVSVKPL